MFSIFCRSRILGSAPTLAEADVKARALRFVGGDVCIYHDDRLAEVLFADGRSVRFGEPDAGVTSTPAPPLSDLDEAALDQACRNEHCTHETVIDLDEVTPPGWDHPGR